MDLNLTPSGERVHIGFFGMRNAGKSSVVNAVTNQEVSVVSDVKGTTTDPVTKAMELLPLGPVMIIDTPGFDDIGSLGELRVRRTKQILNRSDIAVLVVDATTGITGADNELLEIMKGKKIPFLIVYNKSDLIQDADIESCRSKSSCGGNCEAENSFSDKQNEQLPAVFVSAKDGSGIDELKERLAAMAASSGTERALVADLVDAGELVCLVIPIDKSAPKGRLILPQQQVIRGLLDAGAAALVVRETEYKDMLTSIQQKPKLVITDSQVFDFISKNTPSDIPLTSFSILMARYKGFLETAVKGVKTLDTLENGDKLLISEGCTHHRQCEDIGTVKLPKWINAYTGKSLIYETSSGRGFPEDLSEYKMVIHCGGCMLTEREMQYRMSCSEDQNIPFTNYGSVIAFVHGILGRSIELFPQLHALI